MEKQKSNLNIIKTIPRRRKPKKKHRILLTILMILLMLFLLGCLMVGGYVLSLASDLPDITVEDLVTAQTSFVYDENGNLIATLHGGENRVSVDLEDIPDYLIDAVIASEDIRFYEHNGVDYRSVMRAVVVDAIDTIKIGELSSAQGASTITMQLVRNVIDERETTMVRKIKEALLAVQFEKSYDKDEILYYYLNEIYLGPQIYGVQAAAEYYFGKDVSDITLSEAALLVAVLRNPGYYSPYDYPERVLVVRNAVLDCMISYDEEEYGVVAENAKADSVVVYDEEDEAAQYDYPWFVDYVVSECMGLLEDMGMDSSVVYTGGLNIYTTLDTSVQTAMETAYADDSNFPESSTGDIVESAMAIVEPSTGEIKGLMGGRVYATRRGFNRATDLQRSPGSSIKPLVTYGPAVELGYGAGYVIDDAPVKYGSWSPNNDDHRYLGRITMRTAIMQSRNVCAVKLLQTIGVETGWEFGVKLGLPLVEEDSQNLSMTLGGLTYGVAPLDMAGAFATFASSGVYTEPYSITTIKNSEGETIYSVTPTRTEVFSEDTAYIMTDMLSSAVNGGTGTAAKISGWQTAGKTGTNGLPNASDDPDYAGKSGTKDAWFCGYTTALAGAVWMGYDNKKDEDGNLQYLSNVYGGTYPARLFNAVMTNALTNYENKDFVRPEGVVSLTVDTKTGVSPTELTPSQYITSELVRSGFGLIGDGTTWTQAEVCADSIEYVTSKSGTQYLTADLANAFCPNKVTEVFLLAPDGVTPSKDVQDYLLYLPTTVCTLHTTYQTGLIGVYVCTDPRHNGKVYLANIAAEGSSGGCPSEYVELRYYAPGNVPTEYCDLEDHQVTGDKASSYVQEEDDPSSTSWHWNQGGGNDEDEDVPNTPSDLNASANPDGIYLSWQGNNNSAIIYVLERTDNSTGDSERFVVIGTEYMDTDVESGVSYTYRVYAYNEDSQTTSKWSSSAGATY